MKENDIIDENLRGQGIEITELQLKRFSKSAEPFEDEGEHFEDTSAKKNFLCGIVTEMKQSNVSGELHFPNTLKRDFIIKLISPHKEKNHSMFKQERIYDIVDLGRGLTYLQK